MIVPYIPLYRKRCVKKKPNRHNRQYCHCIFSLCSTCEFDISVDICRLSNAGSMKGDWTHYNKKKIKGGGNIETELIIGC